MTHGGLRHTMGKDRRKLLISFAIWTAIATFLFIHIELQKILAKPIYLQNSDPQALHMGSEASVFEVFASLGTDGISFPLWFNSLTEEEKRGYILFVRSHALTSLLGTKIGFSDEEWLSSDPERITELTEQYLYNSKPDDIINGYSALSSSARKQRELFLERNQWLAASLGDNYKDFEQGLFYFFFEHAINDSEIIQKAEQFRALNVRVATLSQAIQLSRDRRTRISPKSNVTDEQIAEIVSASYFTELFYGIPADFMLLITAYETNFSPAFWEGGCGTTQQTLRAANTVLHSDYWISKVQESSGANIQLQMVSLSSLDNIFLSITEAAKTIAIKAAELNITTSEISPEKMVSIAGQTLPVTWVMAYRYNGSKNYARQYAQMVHHYYKTRKYWLEAYDSKGQNLYALNK